MRGVLLACVSALVLAVPAQAGTYIELDGHVVAGTVPVNEFDFTPKWQASLLVSGYCSSEFCNLTLNGNRMSIYIAGGGGRELYFDFDLGPEDFTDGEWHSGSGSGFFYGYPDDSGYYVEQYTFSAARLFYDDVYVPFDTVPVFHYGPAYGVPEPATWAMMIGGFALAGGAMRRRRYSVTFA